MMTKPDRGGYLATSLPHTEYQEFNKGEHCFIEDEVSFPYKIVKKLGHGQTSVVEKIKHVRTGHVFARKSIPIDRDKIKRKKLFENEVKIILTLAPHRHIVSVFATYETKTDLNLILFPAANEGDLGAFLRDLGDKLVDRENFSLSSLEKHQDSVLRRAFGCLASGLAFMRKRRIRHKDIKPGNIVIHLGLVFYTDFGRSLDSSNRNHSTTTGRPDDWTKKFASPEVWDYCPRNSKSDVFSLGCVFLLILSALTSTVKLDRDRSFCEYVEDIHDQIQDDTASTVLEKLKRVAISMTARDPSERTTASSVSVELSKDQHLCCSHCFSAGIMSTSMKVERNDRDALDYLETSQDEYFNTVQNAANGYLNSLDRLEQLQRQFDSLRLQQTVRLGAWKFYTDNEPDNREFESHYMNLLEVMIDCELRVQRLKQDTMHHENIATVMNRRSSDPMHLEKQPPLPSDMVSRAQTDSAVPTILHDPKTKQRIREWLLDDLQNNATHRALWLNTLREPGTSPTGDEFWEECAASPWYLDSSEWSDQANEDLLSITANSGDESVRGRISRDSEEQEIKLASQGANNIRTWTKQEDVASIGDDASTSDDAESLSMIRPLPLLNHPASGSS